MTRENGFDKSGQLTSITYKAASEGITGDLTYRYDLDGQIVEKGGSMAQSAQSAEMTDATYDAAAKMSGVNGVSLSYDGNGNLASDGSTRYVWNTRDQLIEMRTSQAALIAQFSYDALGRRRKKTVYDETTRYVYDRHDAVQERGADTQVKAVYVTGALDERLQRISLNVNGAATRIDTYVADQIGSILAIKDMGGANIVAYSYDEYGNSQSSGVDSNPFQFTGRENDGNGLYYYRARYYSPALRRFLQSDPISLLGGINEYSYVEGNPLSKTDASGLVAGPVSPNTGSPNSRGPTTCSGNDCVTPPTGTPPNTPPKDPKKYSCAEKTSSLGACLACCASRSPQQYITGKQQGGICSEQCYQKADITMVPISTPLVCTGNE